MRYRFSQDAETDLIGDSIAVFGRSEGFGAQATSAIDGKAPMGWSSLSGDGAFRARALLFYAGDLGTEINHTLVVAYDDDTNAGQRWLGIDYFEVGCVESIDQRIPQRASSDAAGVLRSSSSSSSSESSTAGSCLTSGGAARRRVALRG